MRIAELVTGLAVVLASAAGGGEAKAGSGQCGAPNGWKCYKPGFVEFDAHFSCGGKNFYIRVKRSYVLKATEVKGVKEWTTSCKVVRVQQFGSSKNLNILTSKEAGCSYTTFSGFVEFSSKAWPETSYKTNYSVNTEEKETKKKVVFSNSAKVTKTTVGGKPVNQISICP